MARRRFQRGQLLRSGDNWLGRWREDVVDASGVVKRPHVKRELGTIADFPTKRLAERELARRLEPINNVEYRPSRRITFEVFAQKWLKEVLVHQKRSSQSSARSHVRVHLLPAFGEMNMADIRMERIQQFVTGSDKSPKTVKNVIVTLMSMWNTAQAWGYVQHNPFPRGASGRLLLKLPAARPGETYDFTVEEALGIIDKAEGQWKTFFRTLGETGVRPGEMAGLLRTGVDREKHTLKITQSVWGQEVQTPKSTAGVRTFAISDSLTKELGVLIDSTPDNEYGLVFVTESRGNRKIDRDRIIELRGIGWSWDRVAKEVDVPRTTCMRAAAGKSIRQSGGKPLSMDNFLKRVLNPILAELGIDKKLERLGITRCGNYAFRHMNATLMDTLNTPMKTRQKRLGHAQIETTLKHYTHAIDADDRMAADRIGALLAQPTRQERVQ